MVRSRAHLVTVVVVTILLQAALDAQSFPGTSDATSDPAASPSFSGDAGIFQLAVPYPLPPRVLTVAAFRSNTERAPQRIDFSVIGVSVGYSVSERFEVFGAVGVNRLDVDDITQPGHSRDFPFIDPSGSETTAWITGLGDTLVGAKLVMLNDRASVPDDLAASIRVTLKIPTADRDEGLGAGVPSLGTDLLVARTLAGGTLLSAAFGFTFAGRSHGFDVGRAATWGVGLSIPTSTSRRFHLNAEVVGQTYISGDCPRSYPVDFAGGPSVSIGRFTLKAAAIGSFDRQGRFKNGSRWDPGYQLSLAIGRPHGRTAPEGDFE